MPSKIHPKSGAGSSRALIAVAASVLLLVPVRGGALGEGQGTDGPQMNGEVKATILKMEQEKVEALKKGGDAIADWEDRVFADDLICFGSGFSGVCSKAEMVAEHRSGQRTLRTVHHDDYRVQVYGNTAILSFRGNNIMERKGQILTGVVRTTDVYVKQDGAWRIVAHLVTPVRPE